MIHRIHDEELSKMGQNQSLDSNGMVKVVFYPEGRMSKVPKGSMLLAAAQAADVNLEASCNGNSTCGKCKIQWIDGAVTEVTPEERKILHPAEIESGYRLACATQILGDVTVRIGREIKQTTLQIEADGLKPDFVIDAPLQKRYLELTPPTLDDPATDLERVVRAIGQPLAKGNLLMALRNLPELLRAVDFKVTAVFEEDQCIGIEAGDTHNECYGIALDIGTTTVVLTLIEIHSGVELATAAAANAQGKYGQDVISRIQFSTQAGGLKQLREAIVQQINELITIVCRKSGVKREYLYELVVAGNTTMTHLLLGVSPENLAHSPYVAVFREGISLGAAEMGIQISPFGLVYIIPSVASYVGGDIVAGMLAIGLQHSASPALLVDIGTNGELVFGSRDDLVACSCAAGPALEGMNISCGTIAVAGAIEKVDIGPDVVLQTIDNQPGVGICGSGIIDTVAELLRKGISERSGRMRSRKDFLAIGGEDSLAERIKDHGELRFELIAAESTTTPARENRAIFISQKDLRQVQLAKAAIASAIEVLMKEKGINASKVAQVYVAGAFGKHLRKENLLRTGFIPAELGERIVFAGNTAKTGAILCLLSKEMRLEAEQIAKKTRYFELSVYPGYDQLFFKAIAFPSSHPSE
jgi:uncharacterized 2Fe-2S/4Fe-4S cluster protein (DUF4445 family)